MHFTLSSTLIWVCLWAVRVSAGDDTCRMKGNGGINTFSGSKEDIRLPCKYEATNMICQGYRVQVSPGASIDKNGRYFVETVWLSVRREDTNYKWKGRTSTKIVSRHFKDGRDPFRTKGDSTAGNFTVITTSKKRDRSVTLTVSDADFKVTYFMYKAKKQSFRKRAGVLISCPNPEFNKRGPYPTSICGNLTDKRAVKNRRLELGVDSRKQTIIYDILNNALPTQTNYKCEKAFKVFNACPNRAEAVKSCWSLVSKTRLMKCLRKFFKNPMNIFIHCLKYVCTGDTDECDLLHEAVEGCKNLDPNLPQKPCL